VSVLLTHLFVCLFVCLFGQRFLDNQQADSRQSSHAGVLWFRMCLLHFWGLAAPGGRKKGQMKFSLLSPRLLAEPWRLEGWCERAGRNESQRRLSSAVSPVYSTRTNMHFDTMRSIQRSFVHSTTMSPLYRVPAVFAPRDSEPARRGDRLLSHVGMSGHETSNSKEE